MTDDPRRISRAHPGSCPGPSTQSLTASKASAGRQEPERGDPPMTDDPRPLPDKRIQKVARLLEESSLGTAGARQLRDRAINDKTARIRCRAHFAASSEDEKWWLANQYNREALIQKADELAASGFREISTLLTRLACQTVIPQAAENLRGGTVRDLEAVPSSVKITDSPCQEYDADWRSFRAFYQREIGSFSRILRERIDLPEETAQNLIGQAMIKAFDDWEHIAVMSDPGEWVIGYALQLYRRCKLPDEDDSWVYGDVPPASGTPGQISSSLNIQCAYVRVTGALARFTEPPLVEPPPPEIIGPGRGLTVYFGGPHYADHELARYETRIAFERLYRAHALPLVRMATLLVGDAAVAEEAVQESFVALYARWQQADLVYDQASEWALSYLRRSVVNRSRSILRYRAATDYWHGPLGCAPDLPSAEEETVNLLERSAVIGEILALPARQREALVLRYYCDLPETAIAEIMGISKGAVKSHTARAMTALRKVLSSEDSGDMAAKTLSHTSNSAIEASARRLSEPGSERLLSVAEVAALFRVDPKTVTRWAAAGRITGVRTPGGHRRFRESEVRALLRRKGEPSPDGPSIA